MNKQPEKFWRKGTVGVESLAQGWHTQPGDLDRFFAGLISPNAWHWVKDLVELLAIQAIGSSFRFKDMTEQEIRDAAQDYINKEEAKL